MRHFSVRVPAGRWALRAVVPRAYGESASQPMLATADFAFEIADCAT